MTYKLDHDYHIHSYISECSKSPEQTPENILKLAKERGIRRIVLTDHFWDESVLGASDWYKTYHKLTDLKKALPLPTDNDVEFLFGCETDMDKNGVIGLSRDNFDAFDFIIVPTTHLHMKGFTINEEDYGNVDRLAKLWVERLDMLLNADLPFGKVGVAHLSTACIAYENNLYLEVLKRLPEDEMYRLFKKAAGLGVGIEINGSDIALGDDDIDVALRPLRIAKECGCKFYYGSDAHTPKGFDKDKYFDRAVRLLGLTEDDKFHISR